LRPHLTTDHHFLRASFSRSRHHAAAGFFFNYRSEDIVDCGDGTPGFSFIKRGRALRGFAPARLLASSPGRNSHCLQPVDKEGRPNSLTPAASASPFDPFPHIHVVSSAAAHYRVVEMWYIMTTLAFGLSNILGPGDVVHHDLHTHLLLDIASETTCLDCRIHAVFVLFPNTFDL
jgi:hypothetical protein